MRMRNTLGLLLLAACSSVGPSRLPADTTHAGADGSARVAAPAADGPVRAAPVAAPDGAARLPRTVLPRRYALDLTVDPSAAGFSGSVVIDVDVASATREIVLHAEGLDLVDDVVVRTGDRAMTATRLAGPHGGLRLTTSAAIPAGAASIECRFAAPYSQTGEGLYRIVEGDDRYAFTQFESTYARRAFPCFDEPGFKAVFDVTLRVPHGLVVLANAPEVSRTEGPDGAPDVVRFSPTPPIPTYVAAWTVGPWDVVAAPPGTSRVPLRVVAARGRGRFAAWALARTPHLLASLEDWFGEPYPFAKLDLVAAPQFRWGGMENAGLIAFREDTLLLDADNLPVRDRANAEDTIAHELAHMWFGDMVTPAWWDDIWLNEAFATWLAARIVDRVSPELDAGLASLADAAATMRIDSRPDTRAVRQPVEDLGDVANAFDDITYRKGSRLLVMTEAWTGEKLFRRGVREYLAAHRWGTATSADLFAALADASARPVDDLLPAFLDRPGVPVIRSQGSTRAGNVETRFVEQSRWAPSGRALPPAAPWTIPVTVFQSWNTEFRPRTTLVTDRATSIELWAEAGPTSLNADGAGWYVFVPSLQELRTAVADRRHISRADRVSLATQIPLLRDSGDLSVADAIEMSIALAADGDRFTVGAVCDLFRDLDGLAVDDALRPAFQRLVRETLAPHLARIGPEQRADEPASARFLRADLTLTLGAIGADDEVRARCLATTRAFLADPARALREPLRAALVVAASGGDAALWSELRRALDRPLPPDVRRRIVTALGSFGDPALAERSCELLLDGTARPSEDLWSLAWTPAWIPQRDSSLRARWNWVTLHYNALRKLVGDESAASFPSFAESLRTRADRDAVAAFFASLGSPPDGTERNLALALASIAENEQRAVPLRAGLAEFLARPR